MLSKAEDIVKGDIILTYKGKAIVKDIIDYPKSIQFLTDKGVVAMNKDSNKRIRIFSEKEPKLF